MDSASLLDGDMALSLLVFNLRTKFRFRARVYTINLDAGSAQLPPTGNIGSEKAVCSDR